MEQTSLDYILDKDKPEPAPAPKPEPAPKPDAGTAPVGPVPAEAPARERTAREQWRDKEAAAQTEGSGMERDPVTGQFVAKKAEPEAKAEPAKEPAAEPAKPPQPPQQEMTAKERAAFAAVTDERRKRQQLEREIAELRARAAPAPAQQEQQPKTFWDDPEGALRAHEERLQSTNVTTRLQTAEMLARSKYTDFDAKVAVFANLVQSTPGLAQQWISSPDPGEFAYSTGKNHMLLEQAGSLDAVTEKVRKETEVSVRAKVEAEYKAKQEELERQRAALPPSLSDARGASAMNRAVWSGPPPLDDIIK